MVDSAAPPSVIRALWPCVRRLEGLRAAREPLAREQVLRLYPAVAAAQDALDRLADEIERIDDRGRAPD